METNRIILRPWCDSDAETLFKWASDPDVGPRAKRYKRTDWRYGLWSFVRVRPALQFPSHHSEQGNGIPALHRSPHDIFVYHPSFPPLLHGATGRES